MAFASKCSRLFSIIPRLSSQAKIASFSNGFLNSALKNYKAPDKKFWISRCNVAIFGSLAAAFLTPQRPEYPVPEETTIPQREQILELIKDANRATKIGDCVYATSVFQKVLGILNKFDKTEIWKMNEDHILQAAICLYDSIVTMGNFKRSEDTYRKVMTDLLTKDQSELENSVVDLVLKLCPILIAQGKFKDAERSYKTIIQRQNYRITTAKDSGVELKKYAKVYCSLVLCYTEYATMLLKEGRLHDAMEQQTTAVELHRISPCYNPASLAVLLYDSANMCIMEGDGESAIPKLNEALALSENPTFYCSLARAYYYMGKMEKAKHMARRGLNLAEEKGNDTEIQYARFCVEEIDRLLIDPYPEKYYFECPQIKPPKT